MSKILAIHGIGQQFVGANTLKVAWFNAVRDGLLEVSDIVLAAEDFEVASYGPLFRRAGARGDPAPAPEELNDMETALVQRWWHEAAARSRAATGRDGDEESSIQDPALSGRARTPVLVQQALRQLSMSRFFHALGGDLAVLRLVREAYSFLHDPGMKQAILARVGEQVRPDTRIIIAHSLGSVVAYEALCARPDWQVHTLVTIGSPLGVEPMIFDALTPAPVDGRAAWPGKLARWVNIADEGDIVALEKRLAPRFGAVQDELTYNGWHAHDACTYLTGRETGLAIASAWRETQ